MQMSATVRLNLGGTPDVFSHVCSLLAFITRVFEVLCVCILCQNVVWLLLLLLFLFFSIFSYFTRIVIALLSPLCLCVVYFANHGHGKVQFYVCRNTLLSH